MHIPAGMGPLDLKNAFLCTLLQHVWVGRALGLVSPFCHYSQHLVEGNPAELVVQASDGRSCRLEGDITCMSQPGESSSLLAVEVCTTRFPVLRMDLGDVVYISLGTTRVFD
jgi:hypothetical protein